MVGVEGAVLAPVFPVLLGDGEVAAGAAIAEVSGRGGRETAGLTTTTGDVTEVAAPGVVPGVTANRTRGLGVTMPLGTGGGVGELLGLRGARYETTRTITRAHHESRPAPAR